MERYDTASTDMDEVIFTTRDINEIVSVASDLSNLKRKRAGDVEPSSGRKPAKGRTHPGRQEVVLAKGVDALGSRKASTSRRQEERQIIQDTQRNQFATPTPVHRGLQGEPSSVISSARRATIPGLMPPPSSAILTQAPFAKGFDSCHDPFVVPTIPVHGPTSEHLRRHEMSGQVCSGGNLLFSRGQTRISGVDLLMVCTKLRLLTDQKTIRSKPNMANMNPNDVGADLDSVDFDDYLDFEPLIDLVDPNGASWSTNPGGPGVENGASLPAPANLEPPALHAETQQPGSGFGDGISYQQHTMYDPNFSNQGQAAHDGMGGGGHPMMGQVSPQAYATYPSMMDTNQPQYGGTATGTPSQYCYQQQQQSYPTPPSPPRIMNPTVPAFTNTGAPVRRLVSNMRDTSSETSGGSVPPTQQELQSSPSSGPTRSSQVVSPHTTHDGKRLPVQREKIAGSSILQEDPQHVVFYISPDVGDELPAANTKFDQVMEKHCDQGTYDAKTILSDSDLKGMKYCLIYENGKKKKFGHGASWKREWLAVFEYSQDFANLHRWLKPVLAAKKKSAEAVVPDQAKRRRQDVDAPRNDVEPSGSVVTHQDLRVEIIESESLLDFRRVFETPMFRACVETLEKEQIGNRFKWAVLWAKTLYSKNAEQKEEAKARDEDRRTLSRWVFALIDRLDDDKYTKEALAAEFLHEIDRIVKVILPMDRANALYALFDKTLNRRGKAWYSKKDTELMKEIGAIGPDYNKEHPINKRYRVLLDILKEELAPSKLAEQEHLLQPTLCPLVMYGEEVVEKAELTGRVVMLPDAVDNEGKMASM